jgi:DNA-binding MarR family transcriptional regulator
LLALYIARHEGHAMKMAIVCHESGVPDTTALRWIERLVEHGLVTKRPNKLDARSSLLELSDDAEAKMTRYLERVAIRNTTK